MLLLLLLLLMLLLLLVRVVPNRRAQLARRLITSLVR